MYRCTAADSIARGPDPPAQRANGVGAPMQTDSMVGFVRLRRKALVEQAGEVPLGNASPCLRALLVAMMSLRET